MEIALKTSSESVIESFWGRFTKLQLCQFARSHGFEVGKPRRNVYTPAETAHPLGTFFRELPACQAGSERGSRVRALFIAFYGDRNPRTCLCCSLYFTSRYSVNHEHLAYPFFQCVSLRHMADGACANCVWKGVAGGCSWKMFNRLIAYDHADGSVDYERCFQGFGSQNLQPGYVALVHGKEALDMTSAPRLLRGWPGPTLNVSQERIRIESAHLNGGSPRTALREQNADEDLISICDDDEDLVSICGGDDAGNG